MWVVEREFTAEGIARFSSFSPRLARVHMGGSSRAPFDQKSRGESQTPGDRRGTVVDLHHLGLPGCLLWATYLMAGETLPAGSERQRV